MTENKKILSLDYLKGLMAISIILYHYIGWSEIELVYPFADLLSRLGIYAVTMFYIIAGATLAIGYGGKVVNKSFLNNYALKRFIRIAPMFYIATTLTVLINLIASNPTTLWQLFTNYTLLFGWIDSDSYIATGAWFIGTQLVFYSIFPLMMWFINKSVKGFLAYFVVTIAITLYFSFGLLDNTESLASQWSLYINPLNQLFFFVGGFLVGWFYKFYSMKANQNLIKILLIISILILVFLPVSGDNQINLVTGYTRVSFSLNMFVIFISVILLRVEKNNILKKLMKYFGDISYSTFLLHPLVYSIILNVFEVLGISNRYIMIGFSFLITIIVSRLTNLLIEQRLANIIILRVSEMKLTTKS